jgi:hypothetical protein
MPFAVNLLISASAISLCVWLARTTPSLAGFIISLPISTLIVLTLNQIQNGESGDNVALAKSIFIAVPATLVFFIPFLFSEKFKIPFWVCYGSGVVLLVAAFFVHRYLFTLLNR